MSIILTFAQWLHRSWGHEFWDKGHSKACRLKEWQEVQPDVINKMFCGVKHWGISYGSLRLQRSHVTKSFLILWNHLPSSSAHSKILPTSYSSSWIIGDPLVDLGSKRKCPRSSAIGQKILELGIKSLTWFIMTHEHLPSYFWQIKTQFKGSKGLADGH